MLIELATSVYVVPQPQSYLPKTANITFDETRYALVCRNSMKKLLDDLRTYHNAVEASKSSSYTSEAVVSYYVLFGLHVVSAYP